MMYLHAFGIFQIRILTKLRTILTDIKVHLFTMLIIQTAEFWVFVVLEVDIALFRNKLLLPFSG